MNVSGFYDRLSADYHLIYADWRKAVIRQGAVLDRLIRTYLSKGPHTILDCTCGIGTQAIGLASRGHVVTGTDLSEASIDRAKREATAFKVDVSFGMADIRSLADQVPGTFDVVITCDNSLPHLLTDDDLDAAARNMRAKLRDDGLLVASIRDYDEMTKTRPRAEQPRVFDDAGEGKRVVFQVWDWSPEGDRYTVNHFILAEEEGWSVSHGIVEYRALLRKDLEASLGRNGFSSIRWHSPEETGFFQPIVTARAR